uniref:Cytochrome c oxidase subunit 2 n=1 Tax=Lipothrix lubbocki TaxID=1387126 RepID=A0A6H0EWX8_9HEXA|nr:cytochrome c oxidase subunit 2 [Lipothrix lubbocki]
MSTWSALNFQNASSPLMEQLIFFHNHAITILILVMTVVSFNLFKSITNKNMNILLLESQNLEIFWTIIPGLVLLFIGFPSIHLLYLLDEVNSPMISIKSIGHQWYWSYEYSDFNSSIEFDSYMIPSKEIELFNFRLLDVDNRTIIPINTQIRNLVSSADVIHSWTVPSVGVKVDAIPGRLNQINFSLYKLGLFYGQCSEICGANHSFMPIVIESTMAESFKSWISKFN